MGEWWDNVRICYALKPTRLCSHCNVRTGNFTVEHVLGYKKGRLVGINHDDVRNEAGALTSLVLNARKITYKPILFFVRDFPHHNTI